MRVTLAIVFALLLDVGAAARQEGGAQPEAAEAARLTSEVVRLHGQRKFDEALPLARRVLELREKLHGADHPSVAAALYNLGTILAEKKDYGEAEKLYARALGVAEKSGAGQAALAAELNTQLGLLRLRAGDYDKAEKYNLAALALKEQIRGANLVPNLLSLVEVELSRREVAPAELYLDRLLAHLRARPARKDPASAERMQSYLCALYSANQPAVVQKVRDAMGWLRDPERAAERDREREGAAAVTEPRVVEGGVLAGRAVGKPQPSYPRAARAHRVTGTVIVAITVSEEGKVLEAEAVCGHPLLAPAAVDAARGWRFTPTLLNGQSVKVSGTISINFVLR